MKFGVLGPVSVTRDGQRLPVGPPQQQAVLAALLLREGAQVTLDELVRAIWGTEAPAGAFKTTRTYVSRLRRAFDETTPGRPSSIVSVAGGYLLPVTAQSLDLMRFRHEVAAARHANPETAAAHLTEALALFRGQPLAGIPGVWAEAQRSRLIQLRLAAVEERLAIHLELGRTAEVIAELQTLVAEHPFRERLRELQLLALHKSGRRAEAFAAYQDTRRLLVEELGVEPAAALQEAYQEILHADGTKNADVLKADGLKRADTLKRANGREKTDGSQKTARWPAPAQLPTDLADFTGRADLVDELIGRLTGTGPAPIVGLTGLVAVGKTALAVRVAHLLRDRFPDGQLFADLGGMTDTPADPADVLAGFLRAFGVEDLPGALEERAALWRSVLADLSVLVVLDDARDGEQLRHLLPAGRSNAALVTSWQRLRRPAGIRWHTLDVFRRRESMELLTRFAGTERLAAEADAVDHMVAGCCDHPLLIRILGARAQAQPAWTMAEIEARLIHDLSQPVTEHADCVEAETLLERAYRRLDDRLAAALLTLAQRDSADIAVADAAYVLGLSMDRTDRLLMSLVDAHLLETAGRARYRFLGVVKLAAWRWSLSSSRTNDAPSLV